MTKLPTSGPSFIGPNALVATLSTPRQRRKAGPSWQYHPRSDHHSKVSCLLMAIDLLIASKPLKDDVRAGRVACGINHVMTDYRSKRRKAFDLVFHRPSHSAAGLPKQTFRGLLRLYGVEASLTPEQLATVETLPDIPVRDVEANGVYIAFEAKACMTAFGKARPRLFDELNSSHPTIHGDSERAIAAGFVLINAAPTFISPILSPGGPERAVISHHKQPSDFESVVSKIRELPRRGRLEQDGFDALGIVIIDCANDGTPVKLVHAPDVIKDYEYESMINRVAHLYESRFHLT